MPKIPGDLQVWIDARKRFHLSHEQIQMARELGMNPKKFGKLANHKQEPWKMPLPQFIEDLYHKRFGKEHPDVVVSIEERASQLEAKKATKREAKRSAVKLITGVAWYLPEQWGRLREVSTDGDSLEDRYEDWLLEAERTMAQVIGAGMKLKRVTVDVDQLEAWCRSHGWQVNGKSRARYVVQLLQHGEREFSTNRETEKTEKTEDDIPF